ncbi:MAG: glycosyltransferase family 8 protein [Cereibacter changlensis]|uniref:Glycosyltransferase n=2 Tax=Cereibacter changlensis TaxID=402884 RepID=A0A2T4JXL3_9RHOB|nr:glycosyltransferase family 8 protein [Cereibacter changlensis]PTE22658.1 glycosyltransferase [Cereibacter changlensis JA139]PZX58961.1 lipopolysaccharide biosynthesis glycosyltransferase [Cereibacter changlensis]
MAVTVQSSRPATSRQAVVFCCNEAYLPFALHAASQIAALSPERSFDICLCCSEAWLEVPETLQPLDLRICRIDVDGVFDGLRLDANRTHDVYLRIALPTALAEDYDRILYLDSDIFVQGGDFAALLAVDLGNHAIGAVRDNIQWRTPDRKPEQFKRLGIATAPYFNAGVLLMDVPRYNELDLLGRCVELGRREAAQMIRHDQNLYNAVLKGDWAELSPMWNWQYSWAARLFEAMRSPHIVHFIGTLKPWSDRHGEFSPRFARSFDAFLARHFPDRARKPVSSGLLPDHRQMRRMLIKHFLSAGKLSRYLAQFPSDMTVRK